MKPALPEDFEPFDPDDQSDRPFAPLDDGMDPAGVPPCQEEARRKAEHRDGLVLHDPLGPPAPRDEGETGAQPASGPEPWRFPKKGIELYLASSFGDFPTPRREFIVPGADFLPVRNVSALYGDGGTGKSLLALQLAVAVASGTSWLGYMPTQMSCLYFSAEDDQDETHIRLKSIVEGGEVEFDALDDLHLMFMAGRDAVLAVEDAKAGRMVKTPLFSGLEFGLKVTGSELLILDNLADIFSGNENSKSLVRQFIGMLRGLAIDRGCTVLILAHPSLSGMSSGTGTSGNTAWNNSVRSRLYLKRQHDDPKEITDPDYRRLVTMKANYGATGGEIGMRWENGRFVPTQSPASPTGAGTGMNRAAAASKAERVFLQLVERFNSEGRNISPSRSNSFAPTLFARHPHSQGIIKRQFEIAMDMLLATGQIQVVEVGPPSRRVKTIIVATDEQQA